MKHRLIVTRRLPEAVEERIKREFDAWLPDQDKPMDGKELLERAEGASALLVTPTERIDADLIARLPQSVRVVATFSVGYDHIDVQAAKALGIAVAHTPGVLTNATAEIALLLILGAARRAHEGEKIMRDASWTGWTPTQLLGCELGGKRLGILGMGRIGQAVADRARAFGLSIFYSNRHRLPPDLEKGATFYPDPETMLMQIDILSLNAPSTPETWHFLNERRISLMKAGAIVVNTGRGGLIDDDALIAALKSGRIAAAGLDVFENEPKVHPGYRELPNTFLLPHLGSATVETRNAMGMMALDNILAVLRGLAPPNGL
ncbi:Glycerate dehydrogenase [Rhodospirillaceae bacterium LM-1]|nr:Glycerate dehydrogenase [Rhodospirillaceae bacterium LM-1]